MQVDGRDILRYKPFKIMLRSSAALTLTRAETSALKKSQSYDIHTIALAAQTAAVGSRSGTANCAGRNFTSCFVSARIPGRCRCSGFRSEQFDGLGHHPGICGARPLHLV